MSTTKFAGNEYVTAVIHLSHEGLEAVSGPLIVGHYGAHGGGDVWIDCENCRINIPAEHLAAFIRELKRTHKIADEAQQ